MLVHVHKRLSMALCTTGQAKKLMLGSLKLTKLIAVANQDEVLGDGMTQASLIEMYHFGISLNEKIRNNSGKDLVICAGNTSCCITRTTLLLGSFLILHEGLSVNEVVEVFCPLKDRILDFQESSCIGSRSETLTVIDCWEALAVAKHLNWINFRPKEGTSLLLDIDEYAHYASPVNGGLYLAVPSKFIFFDCPADLPCSSRWVDVGGNRHFSPSFCADLLSFLGVSAVVRTEPCDYDTMPFYERDIHVEDLYTSESDDEGNPADLLRTVDRIRSLARATDGLIAIHGSPGSSATNGPVAAALASYLIACHGFPAKAAFAWLRISAPVSMPAADISLATTLGRRPPSPEDCDEAESGEDSDVEEHHPRGNQRTTVRGRRAHLHLACRHAWDADATDETAALCSGGRRPRFVASAPSTPSGGQRSPLRPLGGAVRVARALWH
jgi:hypothetical protein